VKAIVLASPGFLREEFFAYAMEEAQRRELKGLVGKEARSRWVLAHCTGGSRRALQAVFADPAVAARLANTRAAKEVLRLQEFLRTLNSDPDRASYGYRHVRVAADRAAVDCLLISDALFRSRNAEVRRMYVALVDDVRANGGKIHEFSSLHVSGEQLTQMSGVGCLLRFPIGDLEEAAAQVVAPPVEAPGAAKGKEGGEDGFGHSSGANAFDAEYDSDASSDSDASYKKGAAR
jgi:protein pelota